MFFGAYGGAPYGGIHPGRRRSRGPPDGSCWHPRQTTLASGRLSPATKCVARPGRLSLAASSQEGQRPSPRFQAESARRAGEMLALLERGKIGPRPTDELADTLSVILPTVGRLNAHG